MRQQALSFDPIAFAGSRPASAVARLVRFIFDRFPLLPLGAAIALVWANTAAESYFRFSHAIAFFVNDIAMALFVGLLAQEMVEELMPGGALHSWRRWAMPLVAAAGGTAVATMVFLQIVGLMHETVLAQAWPVASAVDVVAAYYVLKIIRPRRGVLPFALLMAFAADGIAFLVLVQRDPLADALPAGVALIAVSLALAAFMRRLRVGSFWPYLLICGTASWLGFYLIGFLPAFALVPIVLFLPHEPRSVAMFLGTSDDDATHHAEHEWSEAVQVILFMFGLVNAGVILRGYGTGTWALLVAGLGGRPAGMLLAVGIAMLAGLHLPPRVGWRDLIVVALATSSGFALALFFAVSLVPTGPVLAEVKIGALLASIAALLAFAGAALLGVGRFGRAHAPGWARSRSRATA